MSRFPSGTHLPRARGSAAQHPLIELYGKPPEEMIDRPIDLRHAEFHPAGERRVAESELVAWRQELNDWAFDHGFPAEMNLDRRSSWDVKLGLRLLEDTGGLPEELHPDVWCWLATRLLPHFVVYRWGWPPEKGGRPPTGSEPWARFGSGGKNGLRMAVQRVLTYGPELAARASEQEFQSIQYRPAFGLDPRVARTLLETLVDASDDPASNYGKNGGTRADDANYVCKELQIVNSLRPLCFMSDEIIKSLVNDVIERLPTLRDS